VLRTKRAYEPPSPSDGHRVLVDRLWPRGLRKEKAHVDEWLKDVAPSDALRKWFGHDPSRFAEFRSRYARELRTASRRDLLDRLAQLASREMVTLVYAAHDDVHNNASVLAQELERRTRRRAIAPKPRSGSSR
jgi:uncharacterized protein YeaO (DUF488 family)